MGGASGVAWGGIEDGVVGKGCLGSGGAWGRRVQPRMAGTTSSTGHAPDRGFVCLFEAVQGGDGAGV